MVGAICPGLKQMGAATFTAPPVCSIFFTISGTACGAGRGESTDLVDDMQPTTNVQLTENQTATDGVPFAFKNTGREALSPVRW